MKYTFLQQLLIYGCGDHWVHAAGLDDLCGLAHYGGTTGHYCRYRNCGTPGHLSLDEGPVA